MEFDPTKPVQTREGNEARIICTDRIGNQPIVALFKGYTRKDEEEIEFIESYHSNGEYLSNGDDFGLDLINIPEPKPVDIHVGGIYKTAYGNICIVVDTDEYLNESTSIRSLICDDSRISELHRGNIVKHIGEIKNMSEYLKGDKDAR